jgi:NAD(P)-dependent dehydrogenase (short-subunit alcohol dehydrogenase family)
MGPILVRPTDRVYPALALHYREMELVRYPTPVGIILETTGRSRAFVGFTGIHYLGDGSRFSWASCCETMNIANREDKLLTISRKNGPALDKLWRHLKRWRTIHFGPIALLFKFQRVVRFTKTTKQRHEAAKGCHAAWSNGRPANPHQSTSMLHEQKNAQPKHREVALLVGVGPGLGEALARHCARAGMMVVMASRNAKRLDGLAEAIRQDGGSAVAYGCDATNERSVTDLFRQVTAVHCSPSLVVYSLQNFGPGNLIDVELPAFEDGWRHNCLGAFLVSREAARTMLSVEAGSIFFVGSTSSLIGRPGHLNLAVGKFGQRAIAQVLARELWPRGIHVAHIVIDADIYEGELRDDGGPQSDPADIAETIFAVHRQPRSAWTSEVDIRPWKEQFWEHC